MPLNNPPILDFTKFTPKSTTTELWRRDDANDSSFEALINGAPTSTSVSYDNGVRENSLPDPTTFPQWGKVILRNITRSNSRKITDVNLVTNTITTEASVDDWVNNDIITIGSQTCLIFVGFTYSRFFDIDVSAEVPITAIAILVQLASDEKSGVGAAPQNCFALHPFESYIASKTLGQFAQSGYDKIVQQAVIPVFNQKICGLLGLWGPINASNMQGLMRLRGYWE